MSGASISSSAKNDGNIHSVYRQREKGQADKSPGPARTTERTRRFTPVVVQLRFDEGESISFFCQTDAFAVVVAGQASKQSGRQSVCRSFKVFQLTEIESSGIGWMD